MDKIEEEIYDLSIQIQELLDKSDTINIVTIYRKGEREEISEGKYEEIEPGVIKVNDDSLLWGSVSELIMGMTALPPVIVRMS